MEKNQNSDRRDFFDKIAKLSVAGGVATLLLGRVGENSLLPSAKAGVDGDLILGVVNPAVPLIAPANTALFGAVGAPGGVLFIQNLSPLQGVIGTTEGVVAPAVPPPPLPAGVHGAANLGMGVRGDSISGRGVWGYASASTGSTIGTYGESASEAGTGVRGYVTASTGTTFGVHGESASESGRGVYGYASASTGAAYGVWGQSASVNGMGVYGFATPSTGATYGVCGESISIGGIGVFGNAYALTGAAYGVRGQSQSESGRGVYGRVTASTGSTSGVYGESLSEDGRGVTGSAFASTGYTYGVIGESQSESGTGVYGRATASTGNAVGIYGQSNSQSGISIMGQAGNTNAKSIVARGTSGQIANLQEWWDFPGTILSAVSKDGYVGVGTSSPSTPIHVKSSSSNPAVRLENENNFVGQFIYCYSDTTSHIPFFSGRRARGTIASPTAVQTNDTLMRYGGSGYGTSAFPGGNRAILEFKAAEAWTDSAQGTYITIQTTPTGSSTAAERMRITDTGEIIPPTDNTGSIGTASRRWSLVRATTVTSGDLVFENGVRATEEGKGLAFKNDAGEKIAVLDRDGNLQIKGKITENPNLQ